MNKKLWGKSAIIDLAGCNDYVKRPEKIHEFIEKLCSEIKMKKYGPLHIDRFGYGDLEGWSCMQFIETSSITAHFDDKKGSSYLAFIDIFSCKDFDEKKAAAFCREFFQAKKVKVKAVKRTFS